MLAKLAAPQRTSPLVASPRAGGGRNGACRGPSSQPGCRADRDAHRPTGTDDSERGATSTAACGCCAPLLAWGAAVPRRCGLVRSHAAPGWRGGRGRGHLFAPLSLRDRKNTATKHFSVKIDGRFQAYTSRAPCFLLPPPLCYEVAVRSMLFAIHACVDGPSSSLAVPLKRSTSLSARAPMRQRCAARQLAVRRSAGALAATRQQSYGCACSDVRWGRLVLLSI